MAKDSIFLFCGRFLRTFSYFIFSFVLAFSQVSSVHLQQEINSNLANKFKENSSCIFSYLNWKKTIMDSCGNSSNGSSCSGGGGGRSNKK
ncbi:unnamed protein product [Meloidogyne enterolobii]|uniref:Uncharacterized protein n=1 Tax=Meloidogyne enterolobii TaxID=390850 RepID=A0ACB1ABH9_MELEN